MRENALAKLNMSEATMEMSAHKTMYPQGASGYTLDGSSQTTVASTQDCRNSSKNSNNSSQNGKRSGILGKMKDIIMQKSSTMKKIMSLKKKSDGSGQDLSWLPSWQKLEVDEGSTILPYQEVSELFPRPNEADNPKQRILVAKWLNPPKHWQDSDVVIKWRSKKNGFKHCEERRQWEHMMKALHYAHLHDPLGLKIGGNARIVGLYECEAAFHVVMEKVPGEDLFCFFDNVLKKSPEPNCQSIGRITEGLLLGLQKLHALGIVHRDVKLENCCLAKAEKDGMHGSFEDDLNDFSVKMIDFDTCSFLNTGNDFFVQIMGTNQYIAPETYLGKCLPKSDAFAVGVCVYTLMTGCYPYHPSIFNDKVGENHVGHPKMEEIRKKMRVATIDFSKKIWDENPDAKDFVRKLLAFNYERRMSVDEALAHEFIVKRRSLGGGFVGSK